MKDKIIFGDAASGSHDAYAVGLRKRQKRKRHSERRKQQRQSFQLTTAPFGTYLWNTMKIEFFVLSGVLVTSTFAGYNFVRLRWTGRDRVFGLLLTTLMMPYAVTLIPTFIMWRSLGVSTRSFL